MNSSKARCVAIFSICNLVACRPSCVYCYKCCSKCYKCCGLIMVSIQSSYTFTSKCKCSSPLGNLMSCSSLTSCFYSLNYFSCGNVIFGTSCLYSFSCVSCGIVICGIYVIYLATYTTVGTTLTTICTIDGSTMPFIIFCALIFVLSYVPSSLWSLRLLLQLCYSF